MNQLSEDNMSLKRFLFGIATGLAVIAAIWVAISRDDDPVVETPKVASTPSAETDTNVVTISNTVPSFDVVRISPGGTGVIAGRAAPGSLVELYSDEDLIASEEVDDNGEWVMILGEPLEVGSVELSLISRLADADPIQSTDIVVLSIPERPKDRFVQAAAEGVVALLMPRDGAGASRILQRPGRAGGAVSDDPVAIETVDYDDAGSVIISGRAFARARLAVYLNNDFVGSVRADLDGVWSIAPAYTLGEGESVIRIDQVVFEGDVEFRIEQPFTPGLPIDASLAEQKVLVHPGNSLWHIARRMYGSGIRYTQIFQENAEQIRNPDLIYPGQVFTLPNETAPLEGSPGEQADQN